MSMTKVFGDYTQEQLDAQYEHRNIVSNADEFTSKGRAESKRIREAYQGPRDVPYGPEPRQKLDIYPAARPNAPLAVWFHGGRWQMNSKEDSCRPAETFSRAGVAFVATSFRQAPHVPMDTIIDDARRAVAWAYNNAHTFGADKNRLYIVGHSSGGHMSGMMVTTDWTKQGLPRDAVKGGLLGSGMYDLEPVRLTFRNEALKLDRETAVRNSPIKHIPVPGCPIVVTVGGAESDEFRRQSREFAAAWNKAGNKAQFVEVAGLHHFALSADFNNPENPAIKAFLALIGATEKAAAAE
jgi:arylformamidase